ncbi:transporter substrate-binding domain-containing protein [Hoeflea alexandrii]|uniref:transporter substrate-binding domain-containing protein n=1 Tax=Hoeflea alexandrii TaxID=288436 RepID=UPI00227116C9|nr:transporter substrate-binding domain-containing protein [Hoeflea alexandrii]MCY0151037.1 transporter substrate-binding domain-containing protein [Hoeflea alexandrii]
MKTLKLMMYTVIATAIVALAQAQDNRTIRIATEGAFPPWNAVDTSGNPVGFDIDVGAALCERAKLDCEFQTQAWDGIIPGLTVGKYDAVMVKHVNYGEAKAGYRILRSLCAYIQLFCRSQVT